METESNLKPNAKIRSDELGISKQAFLKVKDYLNILEVPIVSEDPSELIFVIRDEARGLNCVIDVEYPLLIIEQPVLIVPRWEQADLQFLMIANRQVIHGAFVLDEGGKQLLLRDTLQLQNLDLNELEAAINSIRMALIENSDFLCQLYQKNNPSAEPKEKIYEFF